MTRGKDLGRGLTIVNRFWHGVAMEEEFGSAMGAPMGELRPIINRGRARGFRQVKRLVKSVTGLRWRVFCDEVERRTSARFVHFKTVIGHEHELERLH